MTTPKTPVIGHVTPPPGNVESATDRRCYQDPECIGVARCGLHDTVPDWHSEIPGWTGRAGWVCPDREVNDVFGEAGHGGSRARQGATMSESNELTEDQRARLREAKKRLAARSRSDRRMVNVPDGPYDDVFYAGVAALDRDGGDDPYPGDASAEPAPSGVDLTRAVKLANEWVAWFAAKGEVEEPAPPHDTDWASAIVAMAGVCDAIRLELSTLPSRHRRERLGDPRLHRIFDALEAVDPQPAPSGVAAIFGAAPELPEDSLLFRTLAAEVDDEDAFAMPPSDIARGQEAHAHDNENSMTADALEIANLRAQLKAETDEHIACAEELRQANAKLDAIATRSYGTESLFSLLGARTTLANTEHLDPGESADVARVDLWVELREACDEIERLQTDNANLRGAVEMLGVAVKGAEEDVERLTKERDVADVEAQRLAATWRAPHMAAVLKTTSLEATLEIKLADHSEPLADRLLRVRLVVLDQQRAARAKAETLARWKRRAGRAEQRIAALEQERDGLTLRLGKRVKGQVGRRFKAAAWSSPARKTKPAKGGR